MRKKKLLTVVAVVSVFSVFTRIISFIFKIYLSRTLGAEAIGLYQIALSVFFLFGSLTTSGIPLVLNRKTAENIALKGKPDYSLFTTAIILGSCISLSCIIVLSLLKNHLGFLFSDPSAYPIFLLTVPALLATTIYAVIRGFLWGKKDFSLFSAIETVEEILLILFSILFLSGIFSSVSGAYAVVLAFTVSDIAVAIILIVIYFLKGGKLSRPSNVKEVLLPSLPITSMRMFSTLIATLIAFILPLRLIAYGFSSSEATSAYGRIAGMAMPLLLAPNAIISALMIVLIPEMSENCVKKQFSRLNTQLNTGLNFSFLISGIFMVAYIALGKEITSLLYDDINSGEYLQFATYIMLPMCLTQLTQSALNSIGKEMRAFVNYIVGNIALIATILFLPKYIGIYSVAVGNFASLVITASLNVYSLKKFIHFDYGFIKYMVMILLFVFPSAFLAECMYSFFNGLPIISLLLSALCGIATYCILCVCTDLVDVKGLIYLRRKKS